MDEYLIWSEEHRAWWRAAHGGYTNSIVEAGRYSKPVADMIVADANVVGFNEIALPVPAGLREITR